jgi:anti-sigma regulatory factor (Ser/Thr protein kinase)
VRELSLHIMDVAENGVAAGATLIDIAVAEGRKGNRLEITIKDNGRGIPAPLLEQVLNPFYTTRTTRRVGLGLSLFREASRRCEGDFHIKSREGEGTEVYASFKRDHIDLAPFGDIAGSLTSLIMGNPDVDFVYRHKVDGELFRLDTREVKQELEDVSIQHPDVIRYLADLIRESVAELQSPKVPTSSSREKEKEREE